MKKTALDIFHAGLAAVNPYDAVQAHMPRIVDLYTNGGFEKLYIIAIGKAAFPMMRAASDAFGEVVTHGIVLTKYDHAETGVLPSHIDVVEASHPVPDENGVSGARQIIGLLNTTDEKTLVLCLLSGGASALLVAPNELVTLQEKQQATGMLLKAGANIVELNAVRKHISRAKGGRLAEHAAPAPVVSLILSDVVGDPLDVIASGPTSPDASTYEFALGAIRKYGLEDSIPHSILHILTEGVAGRLPETPKADDPIFERVQNTLVGSNHVAAEAARKRAVELGFETIVLGTEFQGEAADLGKWLVKTAKEHQRDMISSHGKKICLIAGGETVVKVKGSGLGGRNMEMALVAAMELDGHNGITFLSAGTDGTDGPTDSAGAVADGMTVSHAQTAGLDAAASLANNDSYHFFKPLEDLILTGPTGTNVMDLHIVLIEP